MLYAMDVQGPSPLPPMADRHCVQTKPKEGKRDGAGRNEGVWGGGVTSLLADEHETKQSSTSYVFLKESVYS